MVNFDSYYQPPEDRAWDHFVDYADSNGFEPTEEAFEEWQERMADEAEDRAIAAAEDARYDY